MALVLDAAAHPAAERADLVHRVIAETGARRRLTLNAPAESVDLRVEAWRLGNTRILRTSGTGLSLSRTTSDVRAEAPELVAIALSGGPCTYSACGTTQRLAANGVVLVDFHTPYTFAHLGTSGSSYTTHISYTDLGLPVDVVLAAIPRLTASPLLPLVRSQLVHVSATIGDASGNPAVAADLGAATTDLTRALILSAAGNAGSRQLSRQTLRAQIVAYARAHLRERDLTPARIAAEHYISLRTLYNIWGTEDGTLAGWIVRERMERVKEALAAPSSASNVFAVARAWGFVDPSHFSRRFRATQGMTPTEWIAESRRNPQDDAEASKLI